MRIIKQINIAAIVGLIGMASVNAQIAFTQVDPSKVNIPASTKKAVSNNIYIVQMKGDPIIAYTGDVQGFAATKPSKGKKLNKNSKKVKKYASHLKSKQDQVIQSVGGNKVYNYRYAFNGFAARMSANEAEALRSNPNVIKVWKDEIRQLQTNASPTFIGVTEGGQAWSKGVVGEDIVIASIDTGLWPEHPSFADVATPKKGNKGPNIAYGAAPNFTASGCDFGNTAANAADVPASCSNKLVAARCYNVGFSGALDENNPCGGDGAFTAAYEYQSARDVDGHGTHTAATAGGNYGVPASIDGVALGNVSGVAPRARIAGYKVCWDDDGNDGEGGCASSDSSAAIDQAVADGADVINFSVGGASTSFGGPDDVAFLFAAGAGVHVATSNGNSGPLPETTGTPAGVPWLTSVGATQDNGVFYNLLTVNAPATLTGTYTAVEGASPVTLADTGAVAGDVTLVSDIVACGPIAPISGIALASRGGCAFSDKYNNAQAAGASGIIVYNDGAAPDRFDPFVMSAPGTNIPGIMLGNSDGLALAVQSGVHATLDPETEVSAANRIASFSSRGPNGGEPDLIKPDVGAPGVATLAATVNNGFMSISGTSMASPHVAGAFALIKEAHPDWSPAQAKSALMTTARQDLNKTFGTDAADPFDIGAGEIMPTNALNPGLTYDVGLFEYIQYTCGSQVQSQIFGAGTCDFVGGPIDASDLNVPSIGIASLVGEQTITRTVTSVANNNGNKTFTASVDAPAGVDVVVSPSSLKLKAGQSATFTVTFTVTAEANMDEWAFGSLTWNHGGEYSVRSPIAVRPSAFTTAAEVDGSADAAGNGSVDVPVVFGFDGDYSADVNGMAASLSTGTVNLAGGLTFFCVDLPAMSHFRLSMFDEDTSTPGADDLDLRLFLATDCATFDISQVGSSGGATSNEVVDFANAPAGGYVGVVDFFSAANGTDSDFVLWFQPVFGDAGNTTVTAPAAVLGTSDNVTVEYNGLAPTRNLGVLIHSDEDGEIGRTILDVDAR